ncbi:hypothetical protein P3342_004598 [Pyrenophora teres f. teres]|nr:hypothetical protein P3342_004598 [Pyrenophora teres f. teres]
MWRRCAACQHLVRKAFGCDEGRGGLPFEHTFLWAFTPLHWVNSKDVDTLKQGYAAAARRIYREHPSLVHLKAVTEGSNLNEAVEAVKRWLSSAGNGRWLVIYDNYDTPKLPG